MTRSGFDSREVDDDDIRVLGRLAVRFNCDNITTMHAMVEG